MSAKVEYHVEVDPTTLQINVTVEMSGDFVREGMTVCVPTWVAGDYSFETYARDVFELSASDPQSGADVAVRRRGLADYQLSPQGSAVTLRYKAFCYETDVGDAMGLVDSDYAILLGTRYLYSPEHLGTCSVDYRALPEGWTIHHPSGAQRDGDTNRWVYPSYEILVDTPVAMGRLNLLKRTIRGTPFNFVFVDGSVGYAEGVEAFVDRLSLAVEAVVDVFVVIPFSDYTFFLSMNPQADWGLEHLTSNMCGLGPDVFVDEDKFSNGIRVCAHELFHAWNVRRLRPAPLGQLEHALGTGCFTEGLWLAEGFTRYYEFLISTRVGAYSPQQFFSAVLGYYTHLSQQPAYSRVAAVDSSLATYLNHEKYPGRVNNSIDYYDKGMLIAFGVDVALRQEGEGQSLDEAFRRLYQQFFGDGSTVPSDYVGYNTADVVAFFNDVSPSLGDKIGGWVQSPSALDTPEVLAALGLEPRYERTLCLGIFFLNDGAPQIYGVADEMPAAVGLAPGDVICAINGYAYTPAALAWAASSPAPVTLSVTRGHRRLEFTMTPAPRRKITGLTWSGSEAAAELISTWLGCAFAPAPGATLPVSFYENFHGIEAMF